MRIESEQDKRKQQEQARLEQEKDAERKLNERISRFEEGRRRLMAIWKEERNDSPFPPSAFTMARAIVSLDEIEYPQGIKSPNAELNQNAKDGKFR